MKELDDMQITSQFPGFGYYAEELSAFHLCIDSFVISLRNGQLVHFVPKDTERFLSWLLYHEVRDVR